MSSLTCCHMLSVAKDEVWVGNWINFTLTRLTTNNRDSLI